MAPYSPNAWVNGVDPAMSAAHLNKISQELAAQASEKVITHSLPVWVNGASPAITDPVPWNEMERVADLVALAMNLNYTPTAWLGGWNPPRNATNLNHLDQQVAANRTAIDADVPPPYATSISVFTDIVSTTWGQPFVNRWDNQGGNAYQDVFKTGPNWSSIGAAAITQVSTAQGNGFRFRVHDEMQSAADRKQVFLHDQDHYIPHSGFIDTTFKLGFKIMFPSSGNTTGFSNHADWNCLMEIVGDSNVANQIGIDGPANRFYVRTYPHPGRKSLGPTVAYDQWFDVRYEIKWSYGASGSVNCWFDGVNIANGGAGWTGQSLESGTTPDSFQFGFYTGREDTMNEVYYAGMSTE